MASGTSWKGAVGTDSTIAIRVGFPYPHFLQILRKDTLDSTAGTICLVGIGGINGAADETAFVKPTPDGHSEMRCSYSESAVCPLE